VVFGLGLRSPSTSIGSVTKWQGSLRRSAGPFNNVVGLEPGSHDFQSIIRRWTLKPQTAAGNGAVVARHPDAVARSEEIAARCAFNLDELQHQYPEEACIPGLTSLSLSGTQT
jgi:hypothetical protein